MKIPLFVGLVACSILLSSAQACLERQNRNVMEEVYLKTKGLDEGCLKCGEGCLSAVQDAVPYCIAAGFEYTTAMFQCVSKLLNVTKDCKSCIESLVCCVTDSCSICDCSCSSLLQFQAPISSRSFQEFSWLFQPSCHFAYIGNPDCLDCEGKNVYKSVNCSESLFLHYHDYLLDGRWVLTADLDEDDKNSITRNLGDGFDDEECPEKEDYLWEIRSKTAPDAGWFFDKELKLVPYNTEEKLIKKAKALGASPQVVKLLQEE